MFIPLISFVPAILDDLDFPFTAQSVKNIHIICIADTDHAYFSLVLQRHEDAPCLESELDSLER
jgi:hypothetical protein